MAVVQFLQFMVEVFKKHAEAQGLDQAPCFEYLINCLRCCLACVERIVQFLNKTAYIQIALTGKNFCQAASDGFTIVFTNGLRYMIVAGVGEIMMFLGKVLIAILTGVLFYIIITFTSEFSANILQPVLMSGVNFANNLGGGGDWVCRGNGLHGYLRSRYGYSSGLLHRG